MVTHRQLRNDGLNYLTIPGIRLPYAVPPHLVRDPYSKDFVPVLRVDPIPETIVGAQLMHHDKWWSYPRARYVRSVIGGFVHYEHEDDVAARNGIRKLFGG